jgi:conjugal transfer pilus assembly protein TraK
MFRNLFLLGLLAAGAPELAAQTPGVPIRPLQPEAAAAVATSSDAAAEARALQALVALAGAGPAMEIKPPPPQMTLEAGVNAIIPIARGHLNRLRTPFVRPVLKTASTAQTLIEQGVIYVGSNDNDPITLYIMDESTPDQAMSLTLLPRDLPPVDIRLDLKGYEPVTTPVIAAEAERFELDQPYVRAIKSLFRSLAMGEVPQGYGLSPIGSSGHPLMPQCRFGPVMVTPAQLLTGHSILTLVAKVENLGYEVVTLDESRCAGPQVLAVAAWPSLTLGPGESTEVYIAVRRPASAPAAVRPSLVGARR